MIQNLSMGFRFMDSKKCEMRNKRPLIWSMLLKNERNSILLIDCVESAEGTASSISLLRWEDSFVSFGPSKRRNKKLKIPLDFFIKIDYNNKQRMGEPKKLTDRLLIIIERTSEAQLVRQYPPFSFPFQIAEDVRYPYLK